MNEIFKDELLKDEKILWSGQPDKSSLFNLSDIFLIPFGILWFAFVIFWEYMAIQGYKESEGEPFLIIFVLFGIPFVLVGLYMLFGRFIYKSWKKKKTYYSITNRRILIITNVFRKNITAEFINNIPTVNYSIKKNGKGSIIFGNRNILSGIYQNSGMEFMSYPYFKAAPAFYDIDDPKKIYNLINDLRNEEAILK